MVTLLREILELEVRLYEQPSERGAANVNENAIAFELRGASTMRGLNWQRPLDGRDLGAVWDQQGRRIPASVEVPRWQRQLIGPC